MPQPLYRDEMNETYTLHLIANGIRFLFFYKELLKHAGCNKASILGKLWHTQPIVYCFVRLGNRYLPLNRSYKPIGFATGKWAKYEEYPFLTLHEDELDLSMFTEDEQTGTTPTYIYLFNSSTSPQRVKNIDLYVDKLAKVLKKRTGDFQRIGALAQQDSTEYATDGRHFLVLTLNELAERTMPDLDKAKQASQ